MRPYSRSLRVAPRPTSIPSRRPPREVSRRQRRPVGPMGAETKTPISIPLRNVKSRSRSNIAGTKILILEIQPLYIGMREAAAPPAWAAVGSVRTSNKRRTIISPIKTAQPQLLPDLRLTLIHTITDGSPQKGQAPRGHSQTRGSLASSNSSFPQQ